MIVISVTDRGKGFDSAALQDGSNTSDVFGLFSIRERIGLLVGFFSSDSSPGTGCHETLSIPRGESAPFEDIGNPFIVQVVPEPPPDSRIFSVEDLGNRIFIADDHPAVMEGLANKLKKEKVAYATNCGFEQTSVCFGEI